MKNFILSVGTLTCMVSTGFSEGYRINSQSPEDQGIPPNREIVINSTQGCLSQGAFIEGEFLWWRAQVDDIDYALQSKEPLPIFTPFPAIIDTQKIGPDFNYEPGVRVSAGYDFGRDNWDLFLRWTYHYTKATHHVNSLPNAADINVYSQTQFLFATRVEALSIGNPNFENLIISSGGDVEWQLRFNALDFEMGYDYFFSKRFSVRPHMGIKAAWMQMHYNVKYDPAGIVHLIQTDNFANISGRSSSDYWGVGPRFGIDGYLHIGWGFSLYGLISSAALYGEYDAKYRILNDNLTNATLDSDITVKDDYYRLRVMSQLALGLEWAWCFSRDYLLAFNIGWETQYWWNQLELPFFSYFQPDGDLTFSGLDVGARFDF